MMSFKNIIYSFACLSFAIVIGGAVYEHAVVVPKWAAAPPVSLSMFQGKYGLNPAPFWQSIHPATIVLLISSLALFWKTSARRNILITLLSYIAILAITFSYFVPELISITTSTFSDTVDPSLVDRAGTWEKLSLFRLAVLVVLAILLFLGLTKTSPKHVIVK